jgi:hypothetical protein
LGTATAAVRSFVPGAPTPTPTTTPANLRALLIEKFPTAVVLPERRQAVFPTGIGAIDRILPNGGLPRGRITVWQSPMTGGTAVLRAAVSESLGRGERVAWIDGARSLGPHWETGPLVVRPRSPDLARKAAEILLRCGGFALVVLTGLDLDSGGMLRLSRMVHEGGGAFVALTASAHTAMLRLSSRMLYDRLRASSGPFGDLALIERVTIRVEARSPGWSAHTLLHLPTRHHDLRLPFDPDLADRRGDLG